MSRPCAVCDGEEFVFLVADGGHNWERCGGCGYVRIEACLTPADIAAIEGDAASARDYVAGYERKFGQKMARSRRRARRIRRRARGSDFLDIGSNYGFMVEAAANLGFDAVGVEASAALVEAARARFPQRRFLAGLLEEQDFGAQRFDAVYCSEVIEHTADPRLFLERTAAVMREGALLYLTTPHIREYRRRGFTGMAAPGHKLYFNQDNISRLLLRCGFTAIRHDFTVFRGIKLWARRA